MAHLKDLVVNGDSITIGKSAAGGGFYGKINDHIVEADLPAVGEKDTVLMTDGTSTYWGEPAGKGTGYAVIFGDSIIDNTMEGASSSIPSINRQPFSFANYLMQEKLYEHVDNYAYGGNGFTVPSRPDNYTATNSASLQQLLTRENVRESIRKATIIYISLGGNDIAQIATLNQNTADVTFIIPLLTAIRNCFETIYSLNQSVIIRFNPEIGYSCTDMAKSFPFYFKDWNITSYYILYVYLLKLLLSGQQIFGSDKILNNKALRNNIQIFNNNNVSSSYAGYKIDADHPTTQAANNLFHGLAYGPYSDCHYLDEFIIFDLTVDQNRTLLDLGTMISSPDYETGRVTLWDDSNTSVYFKDILLVKGQASGSNMIISDIIPVPCRLGPNNVYFGGTYKTQDYKEYFIGIQLIDDPESGLQKGDVLYEELPSAISGDNSGSSSVIYYGDCTTAAGTAEKEVALRGINNSDFSLKVGTLIAVKFTYTNTASNVRLNVAGTGAKIIYYNATAQATSNTTTFTGTAGRTIIYCYDGENWVWLGQSYDENTLPSCVCTSSGSSTSKYASFTNYKLLDKSYFMCLVHNGNTSKNTITLNIQSTGTKNIYINGKVSSSTNYTLPAGSYLVYYDEKTGYHFRTDGGIPGITYNNMYLVMVPSPTEQTPWNLDTTTGYYKIENIAPIFSQSEYPLTSAIIPTDFFLSLEMINIIEAMSNAPLTIFTKSIVEGLQRDFAKIAYFSTNDNGTVTIYAKEKIISPILFAFKGQVQQ